MIKKSLVVGILGALALGMGLLTVGTQKSDAGPLAGTACCAATCAVAGGPINPLYWACLGGCVGTVGAVNPFAPGVCAAAFVAPTP